MNGTATRHVVMLSGGKDSTALALYLRDRHPERRFEYASTSSAIPTRSCPKPTSIWPASKPVWNSPSRGFPRVMASGASTTT